MCEPLKLVGRKATAPRPSNALSFCCCCPRARKKVSLPSPSCHASHFFFFTTTTNHHPISPSSLRLIVILVPFLYGTEIVQLTSRWQVDNYILLIICTFVSPTLALFCPFDTAKHNSAFGQSFHNIKAIETNQRYVSSDQTRFPERLAMLFARHACLGRVYCMTCVSSQPNQATMLFSLSSPNTLPNSTSFSFTH